MARLYSEFRMVTLITTVVVVISRSVKSRTLDMHHVRDTVTPYLTSTDRFKAKIKPDEHVHLHKDKPGQSQRFVPMYSRVHFFCQRHGPQNKTCRWHFANSPTHWPMDTSARRVAVYLYEDISCVPSVTASMFGGLHLTHNRIPACCWQHISAKATRMRLHFFSNIVSSSGANMCAQRIHQAATVGWNCP